MKGTKKARLNRKRNIERIKTNQEHVLSLERTLLKNLTDCNIPFVRNGGDHTLPGILSLSFEGKDGEAIAILSSLHVRRPKQGWAGWWSSWRYVNDHI